MEIRRNTYWLQIGIAGLLALCCEGCNLPHGSDLPHWESEETNKDGEAATRFQSVIHQPYLELGMHSGKVDADGKPIRIMCRTCHDKITPSDHYLMATQLENFHKGVKVKHGDLTCRACHHPPEFQTFHLVTTRIVSYAQVMDLCSQCHGQQRKDYDHGAHGGMNGYWDLNAGPRSRNHCLDCHNAHKPTIPQMHPAPRPRYRFLD